MRRCAVFGKRRREFDDAAEVTRRLMTSEDVPAMKRAVQLAREAWTNAMYPEGPAHDALKALEARIEDFERKRHSEWLQPCSNCTGRTYRISEERDVEQLGKVRYVVCEGCGLLRTFWSRLDELGTTRFFGSPVTVDVVPSGPFR